MNVIPASKLEISLQRGPGIARWPIATGRLRRWVRLALEDEPARLNLRLVGSEEARQLNRQWRQADKATNVLTFAYREQPPWDADIVFCLPVIEAECQRAELPIERHMAHLLIHGVLHARGMDHELASMAAVMEAREVALMSRLRMPDPYKAMDAGA
ncbi:MAG: rRNA maturation RNase YbeY [Proteobacteria bacterium]|nr:rRNA maturation RNase YbeY [Pseudomonadota bacterium]